MRHRTLLFLFILGVGLLGLHTWVGVVTQQGTNHPAIAQITETILCNTDETIVEAYAPQSTINRPWSVPTTFVYCISDDDQRRDVTINYISLLMLLSGIPLILGLMLSGGSAIGIVYQSRQVRKSVPTDKLKIKSD